MQSPCYTDARRLAPADDLTSSFALKGLSKWRHVELSPFLRAQLPQKLPIPRPFMRVALSMMRRSVRKRAHFSIDDVAPLDYVGETFVPVLFGEPEVHLLR